MKEIKTILENLTICIYELDKYDGKYVGHIRQASHKLKHASNWIKLAIMKEEGKNESIRN